MEGQARMNSTTQHFSLCPPPRELNERMGEVMFSMDLFFLKKKNSSFLLYNFISSFSEPAKSPDISLCAAAALEAQATVIDYLCESMGPSHPQ